MKALPLLALSLLVSLTSCAAALPEFFKAADDVLTDDCVTIKVDRDAFKQNPDVAIKVDIVNKVKPTP